MRLSPSRWCPALQPPLLWPLCPELSAEQRGHYEHMLDTVLLLHTRLLSLVCNLEARSHRRGCCLNQTRSPPETRRPHRGLSPGGGPLLRWPSSNSRAGETVLYSLATSTRKWKIETSWQKLLDVVYSNKGAIKCTLEMKTKRSMNLSSLKSSCNYTYVKKLLDNHNKQYIKGFRSATVKDRKFAYCQIDKVKTWFCQSGIMSVLCVSWSGCGCMSSVCLYCWVTGSASESRAEHTGGLKEEQPTSE